MVMRFVIMTFMLLFPLIALSQNPMRPFNDTKPHIAAYDFYGAKKVLADSLHLYNRSHPAFNAYYNQAAATTLSMCGFDRDSILTAFVAGLTGEMPKRGMVNVDTIDMSGVVAMPAKDYLVSVVGDNDVVMINEQHHTPYHRLFVKSILGAMYQKGYRTLALEALPYKNGGYGSLKEVADSGYYTKEASFGNMIRAALKTGYKINGYEASMSDYDTYGNNRDSIQALNLRNVVAADNSSKTIVYAGYGHIAKGKKKMRTYFENLTKLRVLSVDQSEFNESASQLYEPKMYVAFTNHFANIAAPSVVVDKGGVLRSYSRVVEVEIFSPRTKLIHNRPQWLVDQDTRWVKVKRRAGVVYVAAYMSDEYQKYATKIPPVDYLVIENNDESAYLALPRNQKCVIVQYDSAGNAKTL